MESEAELFKLLGTLAGAILMGYVLQGLFYDLPIYFFTKKKPKLRKTKTYYVASTIKYLIIGIILTQLEYIRQYPAWIVIWLISIILVVFIWRKLKSLNLFYKQLE